MELDSAAEDNGQPSLIYEENFEEPLIEATKYYYTAAVELLLASSTFFEFAGYVSKAAFTPAHHVARQQVARTSNLLRSTSNMLRATSCFKQHVARNKQLVARMLRWCKRGLTDRV